MAAGLQLCLRNFAFEIAVGMDYRAESSGVRICQILVLRECGDEFVLEVKN